MNRQRAFVCVAREQRVGAQSLDGIIELEWIGGDRREDGTKFDSSFGQNLFGDGIRREKSEKMQQFDSGRMALRDTLESKGPGSGDGGRIIPASMLLKQAGARLLEET